MIRSYLIRGKAKLLRVLLGAKEEKVPFYTKDFFKEEEYIIGDHTYGKPTVLFNDSGANLHIGKFCSIAEKVTIFLGGNHRIDWVSTYPFNVFNEEFPGAKDILGHPSTKGNVVIENDVWIGRGVTIMSGVTINNGAVIAANSVVTKNVGAYEVWGGNPAKKIKTRFSEEIVTELLKIKWWEKDIEVLKENCEALCASPEIFVEKNKF